MTVSPSHRTVPGLAAMARAGEKIAMLTCYDASFAALLDRAGVDVMLVGDSLGMVMRRPCVDAAGDARARWSITRAAWRRGAKAALVIADLSFGELSDARSRLMPMPRG